MEGKEEHVPLKKRKVEQDFTEKDFAEKLQSFRGFQTVKVLRESNANKCLFLHGKLNGQDAVVLLEKSPFDKEKVDELMNENTSLVETLKNDIYSTYTAFPEKSLNAVKATLIHPATPKHITKYTDQEAFVVHETEDIYQSVTLPYIESQAFSIQWVYNILEKKTESDRIVYEDDSPEVGFILLPDMKWDRKDIDALYLQAVVHKHGVKSLRDLDQSYLPLLRNILTKGEAAIKNKYGIPRSKLKVYIHYQPSYYHFHVHFTHVKLENPGFEADRAHLLSDVIENIEMKSDFYQHKTLTYKVREQDKLYQALKEYGYFEKEDNKS
ncbi:hypothetical protein FSP39_018548 [Pinctada imbricata]|uniref:m7GpppX diphosphatase n=1 Tax=Pinctada imbricata TaxID=66713 RepID=A0AA88YKH5_PINIB|nr:hypothetical protein FSP39_018548 [Pinctada imbricata]